jgi:hypothetical protein
VHISGSLPINYKEERHPFLTFTRLDFQWILLAHNVSIFFRIIVRSLSVISYRSFFSSFRVVKQQRFYVLTAVAVKSHICWITTPCSPLKVNRRFDVTCRNHLQGRRISRVGNQTESRWLDCLALTFILVSCQAFSLILKMEEIC